MEKSETTLEGERLSADSKVAIDLANRVFVEQMRVAHWQEVKLNKSVKSLVEAHFIVGILDSATTDWAVPTPSPDRAVVLLLGYLVQQNGFSAEQAKARLPMLYEQHQKGGFIRDIFNAGRQALDDDCSLARLVPTALELSPQADSAIHRAQKKSLLVIGVSLIASVLVGVGLYVSDILPLYSVGGGFGRRGGAWRDGQANRNW